VHSRIADESLVSRTQINLTLFSGKVPLRAALCFQSKPNRKKRQTMVDELQQLRTPFELFQLLAHYGALGVTDREAWQNRLMEMPNLQANELVKLHGDLLAYGWIEQNTGVVSVFQPGTVAQCYRITPAGQKALKQARTECAPEREDAEAA
jgi:hypothetical protein